MLNDFCHVDGTLSTSIITGKRYAKPIFPEVEHIVSEYRKTKDPIIWLCDGHAENDKEFDRFPKHAVLSTWGAEIIDELSPKIIPQSSFELMIRKTRYSGFYNTNLEYQLARLAPNQITVVGVCTSICVMDTVGGLANRDFDVNVVKTGVADFDPEAHVQALSRMENLYGANIIS